MDHHTSVYLYFDSDGLLLYVGITARGISRNREHNKTKDWWQYVARQEVEHYASRAEALQRETRLIKSRRPPFNAQQNPSHAQARADYLKLRALQSAVHLEHAPTAMPKGRIELDVVGFGEGMMTLASLERISAREIDVDGCIISGLGKRSKLIGAGVVRRGLRQ